MESESVLESTLESHGLPAFGVLAFGRAEQAPTAYATFGLSRHLLEKEGRKVSQELVISVSGGDFAFGVLTTVGRYVLEHHAAVSPGERHRLPAWSEASPIEGVLAVADTELSPFESASPPVEFIRLLPITAGEAAFATEHGWRALAERLSADDVDGGNLFRRSVA